MERSENSQKKWPFRAYLAWPTFPPMLFLFLGKPFLLVIIYKSDFFPV